MREMPTVVPNHFDHVMKETCRRRKKCITILLHLNVLFEWLETKLPSLYKSKCGEFIEDFGESNFPTNSLLANLTRIISREFNAVILMTVGGAYDSAARTLRWMLETVLKAFVAIDDKSVLTGNAQDRGQAMTFDDFVDFLVYTDSRARRRKEKPLTNWINSDGVAGRTIKFRKIQGIDRLPDSINNTWLVGLGNGQHKHADLIYFAYEQLSSYIHTNLRDFRLSSLCLHPFVFYDRKEFDEVYRLILLTSDIISYLLILGIWMDIGFYSPETGAKFAEVIVKEMGEGAEEHAYFFKELPSLRGLVSSNENDFTKSRC
jgi:hypothetical protein